MPRNLEECIVTVLYITNILRRNPPFNTYYECLVSQSSVIYVECLASTLYVYLMFCDAILHFILVPNVLRRNFPLNS